MSAPRIALTRDERIKAALLSGWFFLTVATLWLLKSSRVTSLLIHLGARETPYVRLAGIVAVGAAVFLYSFATNRLSRVNIVRATSVCFALVLGVFWVALRIGGEDLAAKRAFIWAFYMLVDIYTVVMIELFWTYTNDVVTQTEADKLYGIIGLGGILGGVAGGVVVDVGAHAIGSSNFLIIGAFIVLGTAALGSVTERVLRPPPRNLLPYDRGDTRSALDGIHEIRKSRYLMLLVGLVIAYEFAATLTDFGVNVVFERAHLSPNELTRMYGRLGWIAGGVGVIAQIVLVPAVLPSKRIALLLPPFALLASAVGVVILPVIATALVMASVGRGLNYSIQQSTRESLYVPLTDAQKYKAKAFIDMFVDRAAKAAASVLLLVLIAWGGSPRLTLLVSCGAMVAWIGSARRLGTYVSAHTGDASLPLEFPGAKNVSLRETHISRVFLVGEDVYKLKRPVDMGFLDFRTIEARKEACEAEVSLNERLAPGVYRGVVPVRRTGNGVRIDGDGPIVDWAVHMRRLPDEASAESRLARGELSVDDVDAIAKRIVDFHAHCRNDAETARFGAAESVAHNVKESFAQTRTSVLRHLTVRDARDVVRFQTSFLRDHVALFEKRAASGRVRDGHGDLRLEHVYLIDGGVTIIDCIEFNERFRFADVCADLAFLTMDLAAHGRVDLAERMLSTYARESGDYDLYALVDFYESYRAYVRGKIAAIVASDPSVTDRDARLGAAEEARRYFLLAASAARGQILPPAVYAVGGVIASGKSTVAELVRDATSAPIVDTDRTRKAMLGASATHAFSDRPWTGAYDALLTERVYAEVLRRARVVVESGRSVVIDASFRSKAMRRSARQLALELGVPFHLVECRASPEVCRARLEERAKSSSVSDGRLAIEADFRAKFQPVSELPHGEHLVIDTSQPLEATRAKLRERFDVWPQGLTG